MLVYLTMISSELSSYPSHEQLRDARERAFAAIGELSPQTIADIDSRFQVDDAPYVPSELTELRSVNTSVLKWLTKVNDRDLKVFLDWTTERRYQLNQRLHSDKEYFIERALSRTSALVKARALPKEAIVMTERSLQSTPWQPMLTFDAAQQSKTILYDPVHEAIRLANYCEDGDIIRGKIRPTAEREFFAAAIEARDATHNAGMSSFTPQDQGQLHWWNAAIIAHQVLVSEYGEPDIIDPDRRADNDEMAAASRGLMSDILTACSMSPRSITQLSTISLDGPVGARAILAGNIRSKLSPHFQKYGSDVIGTVALEHNKAPLELQDNVLNIWRARLHSELNMQNVVALSARESGLQHRAQGARVTSPLHRAIVH